jgi:hypothetical protein
VTLFTGTRYFLRASLAICFELFLNRSGAKYLQLPSTIEDESMFLFQERFVQSQKCVVAGSIIWSAISRAYHKSMAALNSSRTPNEWRHGVT